MLDSKLIAKLHDLIDHVRKVQQHSQVCRRQAEELTAQAERLFTAAELIQQRGVFPLPGTPARGTKSPEPKIKAG